MAGGACLLQGNQVGSKEGTERESSSEHCLYSAIPEKRDSDIEAQKNRLGKIRNQAVVSRGMTSAGRPEQVRFYF